MMDTDRVLSEVGTNFFICNLKFQYLKGQVHTCVMSYTHNNMLSLSYRECCPNFCYHPVMYVYLALDVTFEFHH
jgi:hypothetical protein